MRGLKRTLSEGKPNSERRHLSSVFDGFGGRRARRRRGETVGATTMQLVCVPSGTFHRAVRQWEGGMLNHELLVLLLLLFNRTCELRECVGRLQGAVTAYAKDHIRCSGI